MLTIDKTMTQSNVDEETVDIEEEEDYTDNDDTDESDTDEEEADNDEAEEQAGTASDNSERARNQIDRLKAEKKELKEELARYKGQDNSSKSNQSQETNRLDRIELKAEGVKDKDAQDFVLDYMEAKGVTLTEALDSRVVKAEIRAMEEEKKSKAASQAPTSRTAVTRKGVEYWARQLSEKGKSAPTAEMRAKVRKYLAGE
jgi:hypothetical protein